MSREWNGVMRPFVHGNMGLGKVVSRFEFPLPAPPAPPLPFRRKMEPQNTRNTQRAAVDCPHRHSRWAIAAGLDPVGVPATHVFADVEWVVR